MSDELHYPVRVVQKADGTRAWQEGDRASELASAHGYASRSKELKAMQNERQLQECDQMLTDAGVPEWVMNSVNGPVPANSTPERLKWYLARRKNVSKWETDQKLQREMAARRRHVARHNDPS